MALRIDDVDLQRDRMLVERFQEGDPTAFDTLYRRYFARLQRFCLKRVGDPHEAEEIAQEAFARALRALPALDGERRFYPWMTVIAGRLCVDHHRRRGRSEPAPVIDLGAVDGGQEAIVDRADFLLLARALDRLAPRHREVLAFREEKGWTYQQIADHYEVPIGTVEALLFRARKALKREFLAAAGGDRWAAFGALPLLGGVARRWSWVKAKSAAWSSALGPATAPALGVVAVVGSVAVVGAGGASIPSGRDPVVNRHATGVVRMIPTPSPDAAVADAKRGTSTASAHQAPRGDVTGPSTRRPNVNAQVNGPRVGDAASQAQEAERQPVLGEITVNGERIIVASNPKGVIDDVLNTKVVGQR